MLVAILAQLIGAEQPKRAAKGIAEGILAKASPVARPLQQRFAALDLLEQVGLALSCLLELLGRDSLALGIEVGLLDRVGELLGVAVPDTRAQPPLDVVVDHLGEAAELPPMVSVLRTSTSRTRSSARCGKTK